MAVRTSLCGLAAILIWGVAPLCEAQQPDAQASSTSQAASDRDAQHLAEELARLFEQQHEEGRIVSVGADGSPDARLFEIPARARQIVELLEPPPPAPYREPGLDPVARLRAWKQAHVILYSIQRAHGALATGPPESKPLMQPEAETALSERARALIEALGRDRTGVHYGSLPPTEFTLEGMAEDLIHVFESHHAMSFDGDPVPERLSDLRPLVYAAYVNPWRFASQLEEPLEALLRAVEAESRLPERKRDHLLLKVRHLLELARHFARWSLC